MQAATILKEHCLPVPQHVGVTGEPRPGVKKEVVVWGMTTHLVSCQVLDVHRRVEVPQNFASDLVG